MANHGKTWQDMAKAIARFLFATMKSSRAGLGYNFSMIFRSRIEGRNALLL